MCALALISPLEGFQELGGYIGDNWAPDWTLFVTKYKKNLGKRLDASCMIFRSYVRQLLN